MKETRGKLDSTLAAMFSNPKYRDSYLYYAHMIGQCSVRIRDDFPAAAAVAFNIDHYNLYINPKSKWIPFDMLGPKTDFTKILPEDIKDIDGVKSVRVFKGFDDFDLPGRLFILQHEMHHILYKHIERMEDRKMKPWNYATDCAINQLGNQDHMPIGLVTPESLGQMLGKKVKINLSAEHYYEMIKEEMKQEEQECQSCGGSGKSDNDCESCGGDGEHKCDSCDGSGKDENGDTCKDCKGSGSHECDDCKGSGKEKCEDCGGTGQQGNEFQEIDDHSVWNESKGDGELQDDVTKKMIEKAQNETIKSKGTVPAQCSDWLKLHSRKSEVNWKRVLRGIVGNKRVGKRSTIMRSDRRFPHREDLRGKIKDRVFNLLVIADVSGSMSNDAVLHTLGEVRHICDVTKTAVDLIQIDTHAYEPEKLSKKTKLITRKGCGGTELHPALEMAKKHKIDYQALVVLTDGGLFGNDITYFQALKKKVIWLIEPQGNVMSEMTTGRMKAFKLKDSDAS
jgi:predicted metal-dependent peptidase